MLTSGLVIKGQLAAQDADPADLPTRDMATPAQEGQQPAGIGILVAPDAGAEPDALRPALALRPLPRGAVIGVRQLLRRRQRAAQGADQGGGDRLGRVLLQQAAGQRQIVLRRLLGDQLAGLDGQALVVLGADRLGGRRWPPARLHPGGGQQPLPGAAVIGHQQHADALPPGPAGAAGTVGQGLGVARQLGMDHQPQIRQVDAARRHVGGDADPRPPVAQRLQRTGALGLRQLAGQRHGGEAALGQVAVQPGHHGAGGAEHHGEAWVLEAQDVHHRPLDLVRGDGDGAVLDVAMPGAVALHLDALRVLLVGTRQRGDLVRHGSREEQRPVRVRQRVEDGLQLLAEAEVQHLVRLVHHHDLQRVRPQVAAVQVVAQAARRADHHMGTARQVTPLGHRVHATDAGHDPAPGAAIEPGQLGLDLQCQLARRRDHQGERRAGGGKALGRAEKVAGHGQAIGHGLAGAGLGGNQQVAPRRVGGEDGGLHRRRLGIAALGQGQEKGCGKIVRKGHVVLC
ncbi:hypothetical protein ROTAS13_04191 [Roseomonas sp. TAS13]|nr:hypothetical protein ROTAS13_04191 [Roseomonas sp. TAS13]